MKVRTFIAVLVALLFTGSAMAQETTGAIEGVVRDSAGLVLPGATVQLTGPIGTVTSVSDAEGVYRFPRLPSGRYTIKASLDGFSPADRAIEVSVGQTTRIEFSLAVGKVTETIEV